MEIHQPTNDAIAALNLTITSPNLAFATDQKVTNSEAPAQTSGKSHYQRRGKPPLSYIALIAMAISESQTQRLTLAEINDYLMRKFPFFRGEYNGWRNSVRHNLSLNECFQKVLRDPSRPWGKDNYWTLNESTDYTFADGVFKRRRKRLHNKKQAASAGARGKTRLADAATGNVGHQAKAYHPHQHIVDNFSPEHGA